MALDWIFRCLYIIDTYIYFTHGAPMKEFAIGRGVRQGEPFSPFFFIIVIEGLNMTMKVAYNVHLSRDITLLNNAPLLSLLMYADDVMFASEWCMVNFPNFNHLSR